MFSCKFPKKFDQGYILPLLDYASITWGSTSTANIEKLSRLQKRARIILKADFDTSSVFMSQELGWLSVWSWINYNKTVIIYKALNNITPDYITKLLVPMSQTHSLNLRSGQNGTLYTLLARTLLYCGAFSCSAPKFLNSFPQEVRNSTSLSAFKRNVRTIC